MERYSIIKRREISEFDSDYLVTEPDGNYISYEDHEAEIAAMKHDIERQLEDIAEHNEDLLALKKDLCFADCLIRSRDALLAAALGCTDHDCAPPRLMAGNFEMDEFKERVHHVRELAEENAKLKAEIEKLRGFAFAEALWNESERRRIESAGQWPISTMQDRFERAYPGPPLERLGRGYKDSFVNNLFKAYKAGFLDCQETYAG